MVVISRKDDAVQHILFQFKEFSRAKTEIAQAIDIFCVTCLSNAFLDRSDLMRFNRITLDGYALAGEKIAGDILMNGIVIERISP